MGVFTDIMQDKARKENKTKKELIKEIENLSKQLEEKENKKQFEKDYNSAILYDLEQVIFNKFDKFYKDGYGLDSIKKQLYDFSIRNDIINMISKNNEKDSQLLDNNYDKIIKKVYDKYKKHVLANPKYSYFESTPLEREFWQTIEKNKYKYKQQQRENKKGFFEILLNLILGGK